jgi:zinc transport system substrate-binding protein
LEDAIAPGAARVAELRDRIVADKIQCDFAETGHEPARLEQIIEGTGARLGVPLDPGPGAY